MKLSPLQAIRQARGISQSQAADRAGINFRVYQNYEQGVRDINGAKLETVLKICLALGCRLSDIITDEETKQILRDYEAQSGSGN